MFSPAIVWSLLLAFAITRIGATVRFEDQHQTRVISYPYGSTTEKFTSQIFGRGTDSVEVDGDDDSNRNVEGNVDDGLDTSNRDHDYVDGYPVDDFGKRHAAGYQETSTDRGPEETASTYGQLIGWKIEMLAGIVAREHLRCGHSSGCNVLLNLADPLRVKNAVYKVTKQNFVAFKDARMWGANNGSLEYLSLDRDSVHVVSWFHELVANGTYKTNMPNANGGRFIVTMNQVRGNVTARLDHRRGHGSAVEPNAITAGDVTVTADAGADQPEIDAVHRSVDAKYRAVLFRALATELQGSTRKGMVARLNTEMKIPISSATVPLHVDGTDENGLNVRMSVSFDHSRAQQIPSSHRGYINSVTYARTTEHEYEMQFMVHVNHLRWTSDLVLTTPGSGADRWPSVEFTAEDLRVHVTAVMFTPAARRPRSCRRIDAKVRTKDLRYELPSESSGPGVAVDGDKLARFIERALETQVIGSLARDLCHDRIDA